MDSLDTSWGFTPFNLKHHVGSGGSENFCLFEGGSSMKSVFVHCVSEEWR